MKHSQRNLTYERHPIAGARLAYDAAPTGLTRKPATSTTPSASPKPATPRKPAVDSPSRQENLQALLDFLSANLPADLYGQVEEHLMSSVYGSQEPETSYRPAADRRRIAGDSAGDQSFFARFPSARKIGAV
ncbi:hypothetical protein IYX23_05630 [Methylocystis sp. L43]|uniref:hypothetical protein n=1 Tax=unclassified Methylocystis TaxID=2625913 RepID=UPI0018C347D9|nr:MULTISPECIES: hypothetical protein [unclassified Methylocystis]MBG0797167.1 hypothetical protein [Methylocystis sp. L43]MBG0804962.1 hypothetical protein [Methylocystis sp. H15]